MTGWRSVRSSRLRERAVVYDDTLIRKATLFPMFDCAGCVQHVLIVDADSPDLRVFKVDRTHVRIPRWGVIRLDGPIEILDEYVVDQIATLWHFDPWWMLRDERFEDSAVIPILETTNCVEAFVDQQPYNLLFSADLTELLKVRIAVPSENYQYKHYCDEMLPMREPRESSACRKRRPAGWYLDPVW
jgi:hypothetical protein